MSADGFISKPGSTAMLSVLRSCVELEAILHGLGVDDERRQRRQAVAQLQLARYSSGGPAPSTDSATVELAPIVGERRSRARPLTRCRRPDSCQVGADGHALGRSAARANRSRSRCGSWCSRRCPTTNGTSRPSGTSHMRSLRLVPCALVRRTSRNTDTRPTSCPERRERPTCIHRFTAGPSARRRVLLGIDGLVEHIVVDAEVGDDDRRREPKRPEAETRRLELDRPRDFLGRRLCRDADAADSSTTTSTPQTSIEPKCTENQCETDEQRSV